MELDWLWQQHWNKTTQVDYGIESVKREGTNATIIELKRVAETVLPVVLEVMYADSTMEQHYIPVNLLRSGLPNGYKAILEPVWPAADKGYTLKLRKPLSAMKSIVIDPEGLTGDVVPENNRKDF